ASAGRKGEVMGTVKMVGLAGAAVLFTTAAIAADFPPAMPAPMPPVVEAPPPPSGGWYLRGDIGMTNQRVDSVENVLFDTAPNFTWLDQPGFGTGLLIGAGVG